MIGIIEYGAGNIRSVSNALNRIGVPHFISHDSRELSKADKLIFPGVGEARSAMDALSRVGLTDWLKEVTVPFLGICLGMQLLFKHTTERNTDCLGILPGTNERFHSEHSTLKVPHMGWNQVQQKANCPLFTGIRIRRTFLLRAFLLCTDGTCNDRYNGLRCAIYIGGVAEELLWCPVPPGKIW